MIDVPHGLANGTGVAWDNLDTHGFLDFRCPSGHIGLLKIKDDGHRVADDGTVSPSLICPRKGCTFHDYVRLLGWKP